VCAYAPKINVVVHPIRLNVVSVVVRRSQTEALLAVDHPLGDLLCARPRNQVARVLRLAVAVETELALVPTLTTLRDYCTHVIGKPLALDTVHHHFGNG
jgi:hypothetical protein